MTVITIIIFRYFVDGSTEVLFERWFHCEDLGSQLKPIIEEFFASEEHKTGEYKDFMPNLIMFGYGQVYGSELRFSKS